MLSPELQSTLQRAVDDVRGRRHEYLTLEHLLLSLLDDPSGADIVTKCGGDVENLRGELERFLDEQVDELPDGEESGPDQTLAFQRVLQRAAMHVQAAGRQQMTTGNVLASMFRERDSHAVYLLEKQGVSRFDVINYISHGVSKVDTGGGPVVPRTRGVEDNGEEDGKVANPLESFCVDLTQRAREGKIDPLIGRADELERMIQVLSRPMSGSILPAAARAERSSQNDSSGFLSLASSPPPSPSCSTPRARGTTPEPGSTLDTPCEM